MPTLSRAKSYACAIFSLPRDDLHYNYIGLESKQSGQPVPKLRQVAFGVADVVQVGLPQLDVQHFDQAAGKQLKIDMKFDPA